MRRELERKPECDMDFPRGLFDLAFTQCLLRGRSALYPYPGLIALCLVAAVASSPGAQDVSVAPWKDGAKAAYSIIMDDYCETVARGIGIHADSLFHNRGLVFGFGIIAGSCDDREWKDAERMMSHGHEPLNHSLVHSCPRSESWCIGPGWSGEILAKEMDSAGSIIERRLKTRPRFYLFPFDIWQPAHLDRLKALGYLGARSGSRRDINLPGFADFFDLHFDAWQSTALKQFQMFSLEGLVDSAMKAGGWAIRETHGVADGSHGSLPVAGLRGHLDSVKARRDAGLLWVAGPVAVLKYRKQAMAYVPNLKREGSDLILSWNRPDLDTSLFGIELTAVLKGARKYSGAVARQAGKTLRIRERDGDLLLNVRPHQGPTRIALPAAASSPPASAP